MCIRDRRKYSGGFTFHCRYGPCVHDRSSNGRPARSLAAWASRSRRSLTYTWDRHPTKPTVADDDATVAGELDSSASGRPPTYTCQRLVVMIDDPAPDTPSELSTQHTASMLESDVCCRLQVAPSGESYEGKRRPGREQWQTTARYMA